MDDNGVSIGNYKGVMLCNRPFGGVSSAAKKAYKTSTNSIPPFKSSCGISEKIGLNPIRHPPNVVVERSKKDTALSKHRRFLADLQKQKVSIQEEIEREAEDKERRRAAAREKWRIRRESVVKARRGEDYNPRGADNQSETKEQEDTSRGPEFEDQDIFEQKFEFDGHLARNNHSETEMQEVEEEKSQHESKSAEIPARRSKTTLKSRPKWALTKDAVEELEDYEAEDLLNFAMELDFDTFINDLEVRAALKAAKSRVDRVKRNDETKLSESSDLLSEGENHAYVYDRDDLASVTTTELRDFLTAGGSGIIRKNAADIREEWRARRQAAEEKVAEWNSSTRADLNGVDVDEVVSVASARSILSASSVKSLKQIHSARSIAKIAERLGGDASQSTLRRIEEVTVEEDAEIAAVPPPRIVAIQEDGGTRLTKKDATYNLPYMHRNPAI